MNIMTALARTRLLSSIAIIFCTVVIAMACLGVGGTPVIESPTVRFANLPTRLGIWQGEPIPISEDELEALDAADEASFRFTNPIGQVAFVHAATWDDPQFVGESCPHHPAVCYRNTGWEIVGEQMGQFELLTDDDLPSGPRSLVVPIKLLQIRRAEEKAVLGFVYQLGDRFFVDEIGARKIQLGLLSHARWPYVSKYLVQTTSTSIDAGRDEIESLLGSLITWHKTHRDSLQ
ncbi:MAG: exosortase-associated EpsI family protein [Planctomycetota bacterium]